MKNLKAQAFGGLPYFALFTLGLSASYGVFQFGLLYVPWYVALVTAAAFELTYVGLSVVTIRNTQEKDKAAWVARGAVFVSVAYNVISGYLHRNPITRFEWWLEIIFAVLHGAPLAIVAYALASLLLHSRETDATSTTITLPKKGQGKESATSTALGKENATSIMLGKENATGIVLGKESASSIMLGKENATGTVQGKESATSVKVEKPEPLSLPGVSATSTEEKRAIAMQLVTAGYTQLQIGEALGLSRQRVGQLLKGE
jgi:hypothetical protein